MIREFEHVTVLRDCEAISIPAGMACILSKGNDVTITQALGDSFTVNDKGRLLRIAGKDADALGKAPPLKKVQNTDTTEHGDVNQDQVLAVLKTCYDPEIPINIVDLGLVYQIDCFKLPNNNNAIGIIMTLTSVGCGMGNILAEEVKQRVLTVTNVDSVDVKIVYDPPWSHEMISEAAKFELGLW